MTKMKIDELKKLGHPKTYVKIFSILQKLPKSRVLDIGAGSGHFSRQILQVGHDVTALDIKAEEFKTIEIPFIKHNLNESGDIPVEAESFGVCVCVEIVEHIENYYDFVRKCHKVLKRDGMLIITTPNILNLTSRMNFLLTGFYSMFGPQYEVLENGKYFRPQAHISPVSYWQIRHALYVNGFKISGVLTDRYKKSSILLSPMVPLLWIWTQHLMQTEKRGEEQRKRNLQMAKDILSKAVLFGKTLIILASRC